MNGGIIPPTPFTNLLSKATLLSITSALGHGSLFSQATEPQQSATTHAVELPTGLALPLSDDQHLTGDLSWESLSRRPHVGGEKMTGFCQVLRVEDAVPVSMSPDVALLRSLLPAQGPSAFGGKPRATLQHRKNPARGKTIHYLDL